MDFSQEMSRELCSHPNFLQGVRVGGAGVSPAVFRRDGDAKIASGTLAPPNPAVHSKVWDHQSNYSNGGEKCGQVSKELHRSREELREGCNVFRLFFPGQRQ